MSCRTGSTSARYEPGPGKTIPRSTWSTSGLIDLDSKVIVSNSRSKPLL